MDFTTIAATTIAILAPYLIKGGEKLIDKVTDDAIDHRGKLWELTKGLFVEEDLTLLNLFKENPDDALKQGMVQLRLQDKLKENPEVATQFEALLKQIPAEMKTNSISIIGDNNKTVQDTTNSTVTIS